MVQADKIVRSNRKTLAVCIDASGNVIVRAPKRLSEKYIQDFLQEKEGWIRKKQAQKRETGVALPPENLDGYVFPLLGKSCTVALYEGEKIAFDGERNILYLPKTRAKEGLVRWLKENAKRILTAETARLAAAMGTTYKSVGISSAKTRWGTCGAENRIRYTFRLLYMPKEIIEYVIVHELAHTLQKNHSKAFWNVVERYEPRWKEKRKFLQSRGGYMKIF